MELPYTKKAFIVYLKFKCNRVFHVFIYQIWQFYLVGTAGQRELVAEGQWKMCIPEGSWTYTTL